MNEDDLALRNLTNARFAELGRAPTVAEVAATAGLVGDRLSADWRPHSRDANQEILDRLGLTGAFWRLPDA
jgi:hypothetical protein